MHQVGDNLVCLISEFQGFYIFKIIEVYTFKYVCVQTYLYVFNKTLFRNLSILQKKPSEKLLNKQTNKQQTNKNKKELAILWYVQRLYILVHVNIKPCCFIHDHKQVTGLGVQKNLAKKRKKEKGKQS